MRTSDGIQYWLSLPWLDTLEWYGTGVQIQREDKAEGG